MSILACSAFRNKRSGSSNSPGEEAESLPAGRIEDRQHSLEGTFRFACDRTLQPAIAALIFTHPNTRMKVQHWLDDNEEASEDDFEGITCEACAGVHFVNRHVGDDDE